MSRTNHDSAAAAGAAIYSKRVLRFYDLFVLGLSNRLAWRCPSRRILELYNEHVSPNHLDIGVGTGYFLDKCRFRAAKPRVGLMDLNPNSLRATSQRLARYNPEIHEGNVMEPFEIEGPGFDSIGLAYLLHCLPGDMLAKSVVFDNIEPLLNKGGTVFGSTILGAEDGHNVIARRLLAAYNARGIFSNIADSRVDLESILRNTFQESSITMVGSVALFWGRL